eukprot:410353-Pyramimonas_sp.AAC.1
MDRGRCPLRNAIGAASFGGGIRDSPWKRNPSPIRAPWIHVCDRLRFAAIFAPSRPNVAPLG